MDLMSKNVLLNLHILPDDYWEADYYNFNRALSAKEEKDRVVDPMSLL